MLFRYTDNQLAQDAMNLTFFHWGVHGWIVYVVVGLLLAFVCYRQGLPMTVRSCFYPLIGDKIYGWMGDVIDVLPLKALSRILFLVAPTVSLFLGNLRAIN